MVDHVTHPGRLIAIDGTRHKDVAAAAAVVVASLKERGIECAISRFDASGLFGELSAAPADDHVSARALTLVYAADLSFRLRWEIRPVLESGGVVIAASYVDTAAAIGGSHGLDQSWIRQLLRFAITPHYRARSEERKPGKGWKARLDRGYGEYCAAMIEQALAGSQNNARHAAAAFLSQYRAGKVYQLTEKGLADLTSKITGSRPAGRSRSPSRPRSGRS
jgi:hypothetical protein